MSNNPDLKILFMGTPFFGAEILKGFSSFYKPSLVITSLDKPKGRKQEIIPSPVKKTAQDLGIPVFQTESNSEILSKLKEISPDLLISASCGQILSKEILDLPRLGCLNVHPSLLPKYRGCSPIQTAILKGDKKTGVTIFLMAEKIDQGKIIAQKEIEVSAQDDYPSLEKKLAHAGSDLLAETIPKWIKGEIKPREQPEEESSYASKIKKEDGKIDWSEKAEKIERKIRAFRSWPGSFTFWNKKNKKIRLKILSSEVEEKKAGSVPGQASEEGRDLAVQCQNKSLIIKKVQPEGKPAMNSSDFLKGNPDIKGTILK